jgi:hypothetical protein
MSRLAREEWFGTLPTREIEYTREAFVSDEGGIRPEDSFVSGTAGLERVSGRVLGMCVLCGVLGVAVKQGV